MTKLKYSIAAGNIFFYDAQGKELVALPMDSMGEIEAFLEDLALDFKEAVAPYTAADIFYPSGRLRGINLIKDGIGNLKKVILKLPGKVQSTVSYDPKTIYSECVFLAQKIALFHGVPENSITMLLIKTSLTEMAKCARR